MPRGRQYYDPEIQTSHPVETPKDLARIEFYPELDGSGQIGRWVARRIDHDGRIVGYTAGNFDHDKELAHAQELWPGLTVFELNDEQKDSTWEGTGPSPRIWQQAERVPVAEQKMMDTTTFTPVLEPEPDQVALHLFPIPEETKPGIYVRLDDMRAWLEGCAVQYEVDKNPSAALALRDVVDALKDIG